MTAVAIAQEKRSGWSFDLLLKFGDRRRLSSLFIYAEKKAA
jgi:hypothetical protein